MAIDFATDAWIKALKDELNSSDAYRSAAKKWEGDFYFVIESDDGDKHLYLDLWHGEAREAMAIADPSSKTPEFILAAPIKTWRGVLDKKIDPIKGIMTRQLKLSGPMVKVMKAPKAAIELVECASNLETSWP